jgi:hypothetical protein
MAINEAKQKKLELYHLQRFKEVYNDFPNGIIDPGVPGKEPDFIVRSPNGNVGIEHTQIFIGPGTRGQTLKQKESLLQKIIQISEKKYKDIDGSPIIVSVSFNTNVEILKKDIDSLSNTLVKVVIDNKNREVIENDGSLPDELNTIHIYHTPGINLVVWTNPTNGWIPPLTTVELVKKKLKKRNPS